MATKTFDELRSQARKHLKKRELSELRALLATAHRRKYISVSITRSAFPLNRKEGKEALIKVAESFLDSSTITPTGLNESGWTKTLIEKYLGKPDALVRNPHYRSAAPMRLYCVERVRAISEQPKVAAKLQKVLDSREARQAGAAKAYETRVAKLREWVDCLEIQVPRMGIEKLLGNSTSHYEWHHQGFSDWRYSGKSASVMDDAEFLERITINYLRHECTDYECELAQMAGKVGVSELYPVLKSKVNASIHCAYPTLLADIREFQGIYLDLKASRQAEAKAKKKERKRLFLEQLKEDPVGTIYERFYPRISRLNSKRTTKKYYRNNRLIYDEMFHLSRQCGPSLEFPVIQPGTKITKDDLLEVLDSLEASDSRDQHAA